MGDGSERETGPQPRCMFCGELAMDCNQECEGNRKVNESVAMIVLAEDEQFEEWLRGLRDANCS